MSGMSKFTNRLKYYGIGFLFGLLFVFFFFQNRGCSWLPENRVKNTILGKAISLPDVDKQELKENGISTEDFLSLLNDGDINYDQSLKDGENLPKVYFIEKELNGKMVRGAFSLYGEGSFISVAEFLKDGEKPIRKTKLTGKGDLIRLPLDTNLVFIEKNLVECKLKDSRGKLHQRVLHSLEKTGRIDYDKSDFMLTKANQYLTFENKKGEVIGGKSIWLKTKINFTEFYFEDPDQLQLSCQFEF